MILTKMSLTSSILSSFLFQATSAQQLQMSKIISLTEQSLQLLNKTESSIPFLLRSGPSISQQYQNLQSYGCWCYFDAKHGSGKGLPVDRVDEQCMKLHHATSCIKIENCDENLSFKTDMNFVNGKIEYDCISPNGGDTCLENNCYAYTFFTSGIIDIFYDGGSLNYDYKVDLGFDSSTCNPKHVKNAIIDEFCCGSYSENSRRPVKVPSGTNKQCCESSTTKDFITYNPMVSECCPNGMVVSIGNC